MSWKHSGFNIHNGQPIKRSDREGLKRVAQYIIRNPFSEQKMTYNKPSGTVIYRSRLRPVGGQGGRKVIAEGKPARRTKRNFEVFQAEEFIAAITQHIPDKGFQMVRYYGWYSNRARGDRAKRPVNNGGEENQVDIQVIDVSDYTPRRFPSKKWRELIKKVWQ